VVFALCVFRNVCVALFLFDFRASIAFSGSVTFFRAMASQMAEAMEFAKAFLAVKDRKALRGASRELAHDPRSLPERLLAMTRCANDQQRLFRFRSRVLSMCQSHLKLAEKRMRDLQHYIDNGSIPDDDPLAFFAIDDGQDHDSGFGF
jgi:uncharacterized membrane protein